MKKMVTWIILSMLVAAVAVWNIACGISESYRYRLDRDYAIMTTDQVEYSGMKNENYIKGTYYIEPKLTVIGAGVYLEVKADIVTVDFTVEDMFDTGGSLSVDDSYGCIVSSELAYELFGSTETAGCSISFGDQENVVRTVIDSGDAFVIIQGKNENRHDDDLKSVDNIIVNGVIIDVSEENYRGEYALEVAGHHGYDGSGYYYVADYLDIFPHMMLPAKWSDFDFWKDVSDELGEISERRIYDDKDVIERFYYRQRRKINGYRLRSLVSVLLLLPCFIALKQYQKKIKNVSTHY